MSNHTPKPWPITWERDTNHSGPRRAVAIGPIAAVGDHWSGLTIANEADARLASASPELLAALVWLNDDLTDAGEDRNSETGETYDSVAKARAAIARAKGESQTVPE